MYVWLEHGKAYRTLLWWDMDTISGSICYHNSDGACDNLRYGCLEVTFGQCLTSLEVISFVLSHHTFANLWGYLELGCLLDVLWMKGSFWSIALRFIYVKGGKKFNWLWWVSQRRNENFCDLESFQFQFTLFSNLCQVGMM